MYFVFKHKVKEEQKIELDAVGDVKQAPVTEVTHM